MQEVIAEMRRRVHQIAIYQESYSDWAEFLERAAADLETWEEGAHEECYSSDSINELVEEELDNRTEEYQERIEELEAELKQARAPRRNRKTLSELRECSRRLSGQIKSLEVLADRVAYRLNRAERYTAEWDELEPRYERLQAQRERLQAWQRDVEAQIGRKRRGGAA